MVLLSGGLDSAVVAALASKSFEKLDLLHARHAYRQREWETVNSRRIARSLCRPLHEVQLYPNQLVRQSELACDLGRNGWLGWNVRIQNVATNIAECALSGGAVEFLGGDSARRTFSAVTQLATHPRGARGIDALSASSFVRAMFKTAEDLEPTLGYAKHSGGHRYLLANRTLPRGVETYCPFATGRMLAMAECLVGSGLRVEKSLLRAEFADLLPLSVTATPRVGTPRFPREWYPPFLGGAVEFDQIRAASDVATLTRLAATESDQEPSTLPSLSRSPPGFPETAVTPNVIR